MIWTVMVLSLGVVLWWGIGLAIGMHIGYKNGLKLAVVDEPDEAQIFDSDNTFMSSGALSADEIDEIDEWDDY